MKRSTPVTQRLTFHLFICLLVFLFGGLFQPGEWYQSLSRAPWSPPNLAFPIVWASLYILIAIAGWQTFKSGDNTLKSVWTAQLIANSAWSWVFFGQHWVLLGLIDLVLITGLVAWFVIRSWRAAHKTASMCMAPYLCWLLLATSLNAYILAYN